jgi:divalent metal cation (Fe/Co/Zn/Cd) transporter
MLVGRSAGRTAPVTGPRWWTSTVRLVHYLGMADVQAESLVPVAACADGWACTPGSPASDSARLRRRAWWLTALTIGWNSLEAVVAIVGGLLAGSIALVGFGLDSVIEVSSALVVAWRLAHRSADPISDARSERRAVRLIALTFFAIAAYVVWDAATKLLGVADEPESSPVGIAITALSLVVMPLLAWAKRHVARGLGSVALQADAAETQLCAYLSAVVLVGLVANGALGWWWMDPLAALVVAALAVWEGRRAWISGELCACC